MRIGQTLYARCVCAVSLFPALPLFDRLQNVFCSDLCQPEDDARARHYRARPDGIRCLGQQGKVLSTHLDGYGSRPLAHVTMVLLQTL